MLKHFLSSVGMLAIAALSAIGQSPVPDRCPNNRPLLFAPMVRRPIDQSCGIAGKPTSPPNSRLQNAVKNNFCALPPNNASAPAPVTPEQLIQLQSRANLPSGRGKEPSSRNDARTFGEGNLVRMKAFLIEAHFADLGTGESVNCNGPSEDDNDVHIAFGSQPNTPECGSVTAEISPHFRPESWKAIGHFETFDNAAHQVVTNPVLATRLQAAVYRVTGQLFFDASHEPCPCGTTHCSPLRSSVWEIHPIIALEVCKPGTGCDVNNDADWIRFDTWLESQPPPQPIKPPHAIEPDEQDDQ